MESGGSHFFWRGKDNDSTSLIIYIYLIYRFFLFLFFFPYLCLQKNTKRKYYIGFGGIVNIKLKNSDFFKDPPEKKNHWMD